MLLKYAVIGLGLITLVEGGAIWYFHGQVENREEQIVLLQAKNVACNLSQENLKLRIETQNQKVIEANKRLIRTNEELNTIETENKVLQTTIDKKIKKINSVQNKSCEDTINWMLEEAIENDETKLIVD